MSTTSSALFWGLFTGSPDVLSCEHGASEMEGLSFSIEALDASVTEPLLYVGLLFRWRLLRARASRLMSTTSLRFLGPYLWSFRCLKLLARGLRDGRFVVLHRGPRCIRIEPLLYFGFLPRWRLLRARASRLMSTTSLCYLGPYHWFFRCLKLLARGLRDGRFVVLHRGPRCIRH